MKLYIDNREIEVKDENITLLNAAGQNDIYIPHLCAHPELTSYGGCRLCIVEIEGVRGYPTACTTKVKEGMKVRTGTDIVRDMRREIIQLILSEHPTGCLICDEAEECKGTMSTIRKVGTTTGCRWCPKDGDCELQRVVEYMGIKEIKFPVYYQDLEVEKYDPFFDRDYNLCIYCGRCVRICSEHRKSFVLDLSERGKETKVGPAFHLSHRHPFGKGQEMGRGTRWLP
jgi:formate dehydrogenase alpha subunit